MSTHSQPLDSPLLRSILRGRRGKINWKHIKKFCATLFADFPGTKAVCEATSKYGPAQVPGPVIFVFEKVSMFVVTEEKPREVDLQAPAAAEETTTKEEATTVEETEKEIVIEEDKPKEETAPSETEKPAEPESAKDEKP